jgi:uncharacterized protein YndB with AHSA1/START domain
LVGGELPVKMRRVPVLRRVRCALAGTAEIDARPGGVFRMDVRGDGYASGRFLAVEPPHRITFTSG